MFRLATRFLPLGVRFQSTAAAKALPRTVRSIRKLYEKGEPIACMTAHDYPTAMLASKADMDVLLVGDSLAMVALGREDTNTLTLDEMIHHCKAVKRGSGRSFVVADMPFGSYELSPQHALKSAIRMFREGRIQAVKLEGGREIAPTIAAITSAGIPVVGHIGLLPQRQAVTGGFTVQGKSEETARRVFEDALSVQEAGAFAVVLEAIPASLAQFITSKLQIPTIGIGAGHHCSGQVLVQMDALGVFDRFRPKYVSVFSFIETNICRFVRVYDEIGKRAQAALSTYRDEVKSKTFPSEENSYDLKEHEKVSLAKFFDEYKN
ncbi:3-methyl-2-oxobutanoatehydroxymethyltransferase [Schizosaccharomyces japonicus yFS275]|uniref:3-methyl-2-oxobutanoate hydroxymethyltransferase n=1 Tax=Schizosaccharomyces japonicus (strain yFS275 / FY16936) TaxID=402676 RepID=B6JWN4_SCHJY|nr:3-methyl-2-oxobutanoatehydroxymethyltransferase [Schizosaccharomyces japonicus yFS275]EEB05785.1 3-methyl-2-oxobutanoatehydroxymethyltransferase [Schizosaccharomyces japonicus yFS275]